MARHKEIVLFLFFWLGASHASTGNWDGCHAKFKNELQAKALQYFVDQMHPKTGLVLDRALNPSRTTMASLAATGFGYAILANAASKGLLDSQAIEKRLFDSLSFVKAHLGHHHGWLYHFVDWETGKRFGKSEISTVDTSFFIAGALYAAQTLQSKRLTNLAEALYNRLNFKDMLTSGGEFPDRLVLSMGWTPETKYLPWHWDQYAEHLLLLLLGLGHPTEPLPVESWKAWKRQTLQEVPGLIGPELSLFTHQYSHLFYDFRRIANKDEDFFKNSIVATQWNKKVCQNLGDKFLTFKEGFWGLSASDSKNGYLAFSPTFLDGTVCPGCAGASAQFDPCPVLADLEVWARGKFPIWGKYGFIDSFNLDENWFAPEVIGITVGALYLSLANLQEEIWNAFESLPAIQRAEQKVKAVY